MSSTKNMSKELKKLYKTALASINYFFLRIVFKEQDISKNSYIYESVKRELSILLDNIKKENLEEEMSILFKKELNSGDYLRDKTKSEIHISFKNAINDMFGYEYPELLDFYIGLI